MGFKDLKAFNLALLTKQGWQLNQNPASLTHRVFKAKYFAGCSFMEAQVGEKAFLCVAKFNGNKGDD